MEARYLVNATKLSQIAIATRGSVFRDRILRYSFPNLKGYDQNFGYDRLIRKKKKKNGKRSR